MFVSAFFPSLAFSLFYSPNSQVKLCIVVPKLGVQLFCFKKPFLFVPVQFYFFSLSYLFAHAHTYEYCFVVSLFLFVQRIAIFMIALLFISHFFSIILCIFAFLHFSFWTKTASDTIRTFANFLHIVFAKPKYSMKMLLEYWQTLAVAMGIFIRFSFFKFVEYMNNLLRNFNVPHVGFVIDLRFLFFTIFTRYTFFYFVY